MGGAVSSIAGAVAGPVIGTVAGKLLGGKKPSVPTGPDPRQSAEQQAKLNLEALEKSALFNRYGTQGPFGSTKWRGDIDDPNKYIETSLNPELQTLVRHIPLDVNDARHWAAMRQKDLFNYSIPDSVRESRDAAYNLATARLDPRFAEQYRSYENRLQQRGLPVGSEAYDRAMLNFERGRNDAYQNALNQSILTGQQMQAQDFGQQLQLAQAPMQHMQAMISALRGIGSLAPSAPRTPAYNLNPANMTAANQLKGQYDQWAYNAAMQDYASKMRGAQGIATSLAGPVTKAFSNWGSTPQPQPVYTSPVTAPTTSSFSSAFFG